MLMYAMWWHIMSWCDEMKTMNVMLCSVMLSHDYRLYDGAFMYVICIRIFPCFVMLVRTRAFDIYVFHDNMWVFPLCGVQRCISMKSSPEIRIWVWWVHLLVCGSCVRTYHTSNLAELERAQSHVMLFQRNIIKP